MAKTLTQIIAERPEIEKLVYDKYPVQKKEHECANEKREMNRLRWVMAKRLYDGTYEQHKKEYAAKVELINNKKHQS